MDDPNRPGRGRARGRSRMLSHPPSGMEQGPPLGAPFQPMQVDVEPGMEGSMESGSVATSEPSMAYREAYETGSPTSSSSGSPPGNGNGNGHYGNGNGNGNGGNGNGRPGNVIGRAAGARGGLETVREMRDFVASRPPGFSKNGTFGVQKRFFANYFQLQKKATCNFRLHYVIFDPEIDHIPKRKALMKLKQDTIGPFLFDGAIFVTTHEIEEQHARFVVAFSDKPQEAYKVQINFVRNCGPMESFVTQVYNILLKKAQDGINLSLVGRFYYDAERRIDIPQHRLQIWPGFTTSMRQMEQSVLLNVDLTSKVCRTDDVFSLMRDLRKEFPNDFRRRCEMAIVGTIVMTRYNKKTYRVDAINWDLKPSDTFERTKKGVTSNISFFDYYAEKGVQIQVPSQPMLISRPTKRDIRRGDTGDKIFVPEMCYQTGLNDDMRANFRLMKDISQYMHQEPQGRIKECVFFVRKIMGTAEVREELVRWGMRLKTEPADVIGRVLPPEELTFNQGPFKSNDKGDWTMAFRSQKFLTAKPFRNWAILFSSRDSGNIDNLISLIQRVSTPLGFGLPTPDKGRMSDGNLPTFQNEINAMVAKHRGQLDMIVMILPTNRLDTYSGVKQICSIKYGIPSQCFLSKNLTNKGLMSICTKLVVQMNAKVGGEPWGLKCPLEGLMVCGFDVYHGKGMKSVGAMVVTTNRALSTYFSTTIEMTSGLEMCGEIGAAFQKCVNAYTQRNGGTLPNRIIFYRDGVGEGQLTYVYRSEVDALHNVLDTIYGSKEARPKFTLIVVTKRITTRLFLRKGEGTEVSNPEPGTVVDDVITCPEKYDFFLVPQTARQGTVSPVSFNVLVDTSGLDADKMQRFTFKMCHGYFNWSGTVAVPAPCQYAHKLAFLTGTSLKEEANQRLCHYLHYL